MGGVSGIDGRTSPVSDVSPVGVMLLTDSCWLHQHSLMAFGSLVDDVSPVGVLFLTGCS